VVGFANFMRFSAARAAALSARHSGSAAFDSIGCVHCHTAT
jgi:cytochrome c551/c552